MTVARVRIALLTAMAAVLALAAGQIFDELRPELLVGALVPGVAVMAATGRRWAIQVAVAGVSILSATALAVALSGWTSGGDAGGGGGASATGGTGGTDMWSDVRAAIVSGPRRVLSTDWPSPIRPDLIGAIAALVAICTAVGALLAARQRWHLFPLVPMAVLLGAIAAAGAPAGPLLTWLAPLAVLGPAFAASSPGLASTAVPGHTASIGGVTSTGRMRVLLGERRGLLFSVFATAIAVTVSVPLTLTDRADPRRPEPALGTAVLLDPIEATVALRALDPPVDLIRITVETDVGRGDATARTAVPSRWRTAALVGYDGRRWSPGVTLRPIGRRLGPDTDTMMAVDIQYLTGALGEVPLPGPPGVVDSPDLGMVTTDAQRSVVQFAQRPTPGDRIRLTASTPPSRSVLDSASIATRPVGEIAGAFTSTADLLGGDGTVTERLTRLEATMRDDFELDPGAPGAGLQRALIERFLTETRRGTAEQFVTTFVLLARSLGVDARVATGFVIDGAEPVPATVTVRSDHASAWPEVHVVGIGWVAFDPVPTRVATDVTATEPPPRVQSPAAAQPPVAPLLPPTDTPEATESADDPVGRSTWSTVLRWLTMVAATTTLVVTPFALAVAVILALKAFRRRRRLRSLDPDERIRGAWAVATDALVDAGLTISPSWTDGDIVAAGTAFVPTVPHELRRLGTMSSTATFAGPHGPARSASVNAGPSLSTASRRPTRSHDAVAALEQVELALAAGRSRWQHWRWRISLRSLRPATRSPVLGDVTPRHRPRRR